MFFIAPIGEDGGEIRERSNKVMEYIVDKAVSDYDYSVVRADQMDQPGSITSHIIQKTIESDLVIADLTGHNPNVFYELAVRHATGEPYIQLIKSTESIPFDISDLRTIHYGLDVEEAEKARDQIRSQLESLRDEDPEFDNPISRSAEMQSLYESPDPTDQNLADILQTISRLDKKVDRLGSEITAPKYEVTPKNSWPPRQYFVLDGIEFTLEGEAVPRSAIERLAEDHNKTPQEVRGILEDQGVNVK